MSKLKLLAAVAVIGAAAVIAQTLLVREFVNLFSGNELVYGLTICLWLVGGAAGAGLLGRLADRLNEQNRLFEPLLFLLAALIPLEIFAARIGRTVLGFPVGIELSPGTLIILTVLILLPVTLLLGFLFALAGRLSREIGRVYLFETVGALAAGLLFVFFLVYFFDPFEIAALTAIALAVVLWSIRPNIFRSLFIVLGILLFFLAPSIDRAAAQLDWQNYTVNRSADSPYGRITVIKSDGAETFFENGELLFSSADVLAAEEIAHLSLLP
ncbi:MAG: hypothetical protein PHG97_06915, partial [Candidatus Margulisbacteria bacterium]|nr:hypothetical protein [Candidatus Margulisiibacteriota bacterium]